MNHVIDSPVQMKAISRVLSMHKEDTNTVPATTTEGSRSESNKNAQMAKSKSKFKYVPLKDLGFPSSLSLLVENMLDCGYGEFLLPSDSMLSFKDAIDDLQLLLEDPDRFLFDSVEKQGRSLNVKQGKLYGREKETALITEVFHRVSMFGESEILLVDGFSGCGKSKLIQSTVRHVDFTGGFVVQGKFDEIAKYSSQIGVLTNALNQLCILICEKCEPAVLNGITNQLMQVFGTDLHTLVRVLPDVAKLSQHFSSFDQNTQLNLSSVPHILQLFLRVVSSKSRPVMVSPDLHASTTQMICHVYSPFPLLILFYF